MRNFGNTYRKDFNKGGYERRSFNNRDSERSQMHEAICSDCGKKCEVPFRPVGDKPVYCSQCFLFHKGGSKSGNFKRKGFDKPRFQNKDESFSQSGSQYKEQFEMLNVKLDKIIKLLNVVTIKEEKEEVIEKKKTRKTKKK